ncbi:MAG: hypothetical protein WCG47_24570 [Dermatophilaceae bacterium]
MLSSPLSRARETCRLAGLAGPAEVTDDLVECGTTAPTKGAEPHDRCHLVLPSHVWAERGDLDVRHGDPSVGSGDDREGPG